MESYYKGFLLYHAILDHAMMVPDCIRVALIKDKMVSWPFYLYYGNSHIWNDGLYIETGSQLLANGIIHWIFQRNIP